MTVENQFPYQSFTANGLQTNFALGFYVDDKDHFEVSKNDQAISKSDYSYNKNSNSIIFNTSPNQGDVVEVKRSTTADRATTYATYNNTFRPETLNKDIDRIWLKIQELGVADTLLKIYTDRLHTEQKGYIDNQDQAIKQIISDLRNFINQQDSNIQNSVSNLKAYVDTQDNQRNSYFSDLIYKQGISLQQLNDYYNYLLQKIAAISVEHGWDASLVAYKGLNQNAINDGLETIADMLAIKTPQHGTRVTVKGYDLPSNYALATPYIGGGDFVFDLSKVGINDGGVILNGWVRILRENHVTPQMFGALGGGVTDDSLAFKKAVQYVVGQAYIPKVGSNRVLTTKILIPNVIGGYRIAKPQHFLPNLGTTRYVGLTFEGDGFTDIYFDYDGDDYLCYNNNQFLMVKFLNLTFSCKSDLSKFIYSTGNGGAQDYSYNNCNWNGTWQKLFVLRGENNNSEWGWSKCGITATIRDVMLDITESDQFLNYWFDQCKIWLYDGQCVRASAGGHIKFLFCDWSGMSGSRELCTSTKGKYLFELTGNNHARGVCDFRIIGGRFECKQVTESKIINPETFNDWGVNVRLLYSEWGQGNIELSYDASSNLFGLYDNEYSVYIKSGNTGGAILNIHDSFLIGKIKLEGAVSGYANRKIHTVKNTTFGSVGILKTPTDFIELITVAQNPATTPTIKLENCRPSIGGGHFNITTKTITAWDLTLGNKISMHPEARKNIAFFQGDAYGGNPLNNATAYLQLPQNSTVTLIKIECDGTGGTAIPCTWEVKDESNNSIKLSTTGKKLTEAWVEKYEIPFKTSTGLLSLYDAAKASLTQASVSFRCYVEFTC